MNERLSSLDAYTTMFVFFEEILTEIESVGISNLYSDMPFRPDGKSADETMWKYWWPEVTRSAEILTLLEAYEAVYRILAKYFVYPDKNLPAEKKLLNDIQTKNGVPVCNNMWKKWLRCCAIPSAEKRERAIFVLK